MARPFDPRLLRYARTTRTFLVLCVGLGIGNACLIVGMATVIAQIISNVFPERKDVPIHGSLAILAIIILARSLIIWAGEVAAHRTAASVKTKLRHTLLTHITKLGPAWLSDRRSGELVTLTGHGLDALDAYFARYLPQLILAVAVPVVVLAWVFPSDPIAGTTILVTIPLIPVFMVLIGLRTQQASRRQYRLLSLLSHHFMDVVAGLPTLKAYQRASAQEITIHRVTDAYRQATMRTLRIAFLSSLALELLATLSVALIAVGIGLRLVNGEINYTTALLVLILAPEAYLPIRHVGMNFHAAAEGLAAVDTVFSILEIPLPPRGDVTHIPDLTTSPLTLINVTVRYPHRPNPALDRISMTVRPGEIIAITGPSGSGKSTLIAAILGFVRPESGKILVGKTEVSTLDPDIWRKDIAWMPQRPWLFFGTIADNIRLGDPDASDEKVYNAAQAAQATLFIESLPHGMKTIITDGGKGLSAGQRQRIALARAFLKDAPLLLLDEPTANLDSELETMVIESLRRLSHSKAVIIAAHRPSLIAIAHRHVPLTPPDEQQ